MSDQECPDSANSATAGAGNIVEHDALMHALQEEKDARRRAEQELVRLRAALEALTQDRVTVLSKANRDLQAEVAERRGAEQSSRAQTEALARALTALTQHPDLDTFVGHILRSIAAQFHADGITFWLHDPERDTVTLQMAYKEDRVIGRKFFEDLGFPLTLPAEEAPSWQTLMQTPEPYTVDDIATDDRVILRNRVLLEGARSMLAVPLLLKGSPIGWIAILYKTVRRHRADEVDLALALAQQATLAVQLTRLAAKGTESAVLQERNRIARDIHDTLAQGFTAVIVQLQAAEMAMSKQPDRAIPYMRRARDAASQSLAEARRSVWALRPGILESRSLLQALAQMARSMAAGTEIRTEVVAEGEPRHLPDAVEGQLLRIGQEALTNAFKYSHANTVRIVVTFTPDAIRLIVRDDGDGFVVATVRENSGFGLRGMRERAEAMRGTLTVESAAGKGTEIAVAVPLTKDPKE